MEYIEIDKNLIPYSFDIELPGGEFTFDVRWNENGDFFTIDLYKDEQLVKAGEKLVYGMEVFKTSYDPLHYPACTIVPLDLSNQVDVVNWETLNNKVFLYLTDTGEGDE